jgi:hypothetical protein
MNRGTLLFVVSALLLLAASAQAGDPAPAEPAQPEAKSAEKPLDVCAAKFQPVAQSYQQAHDDLLAWLRQASGKLEPINAKIAELKGELATKGAKDTEQRLAAMRRREPLPPADQETQALWAELRAQEARKKELCEALSAAVGQKVRESNKAVLEALDQASAATPQP